MTIEFLELAPRADACADASDALSLLRQVSDGTEKQESAKFLNLSSDQRLIALQRIWVIEKYLSREIKGKYAAKLLNISYAYFQVLAYRWRDSHDIYELVKFAKEQVRKSRTPEKRALIERAFNAVYAAGDSVKPSSVHRKIAELDPNAAGSVSSAYVTQVFAKLLLALPSGIPLLPTRYWTRETEQAFGSLIVIDQVKINRWVNMNGVVSQLALNLLLDAHSRVILSAEPAFRDPNPDDFIRTLAGGGRTSPYYGPCSDEPPQLVMQVDSDPRWRHFLDAVQATGIKCSSRRIAGLNAGALARRLLGDKLGILSTAIWRDDPTGKLWDSHDVALQTASIIADHNRQRMRQHSELEASDSFTNAKLYSALRELSQFAMPK